MRVIIYICQMDQLRIFGVRHHGPGSARRLINALKDWQPDILLIEGPPDADDQIKYAADLEMEPPVALLIYNPKDLNEAAYYPFATFSPEWQAIRYGLQESIPVRFMDLPQSMGLTLAREEKEKKQLQLDLDPSEASSKEKKKTDRLHLDPLGYLAHLAGYTDSERWWEIHFEHWSDQEIFPVLTDMMASIRAAITEEPLRERQREAYMRETIRKAIKENYQRIAVVCGAYHSPVLRDIAQYKTTADKAILRGIKKTKTAATWIPWSYERLSTRSGYGAGVISPAYYELLYKHPKQIVVRWMTGVARLFRKKDLDASSAHVIESVRLADMLASIREQHLPGIDELKEAATSIFCEGYDSRMKLIDNQLIIGDVMGKIPASVPTIPLQKDVEQRIKSARLTKERNATTVMEKKLDLRVDSNLKASHLLHRLNLLGIDWGWEIHVRKYGPAGTFTELWKLKWQPDFVLRIIEAGIWGNTVPEASEGYIRHQLSTIKDLPSLTELIDQALKAALPNILTDLFSQLQSLSAQTRDIHHLMDALPSLVSAYRYGSTRQINVDSLEKVIHQLVPRINIGLPTACKNTDEEASKVLFEKILKVHSAVHLLPDNTFLPAWYSALRQLSDHQQVNGILRGTATRLLFDQSIFSLEETRKRSQYALSKANDTEDAAFWVEGFLHGSGLVLIHNQELWSVLDEWIDTLDEATFKTVLPLLRRTFSNFSGPAREKMLALARQTLADSTPKAFGTQKSSENTASSDYDPERTSQLLPLLIKILR